MLHSLATSHGRTRVPEALTIGRVRYTTHAQGRVEERAGLTREEVQHLLEAGRAIHLGDNKTEGRSYFLFCSPKTGEFFVAVGSIEGPASTAWIITILDQAMHERDRGPLCAHDLERAASLALAPEAFAAWRLAFNRAAQQLNPKLLSLRVTFLAPDGAARSVDLAPIGAAPSDYFAGGNLQALRTFEPFWRWANKALAQELGTETDQAVQNAVAIQLCADDAPVADFLTAEDRSILPAFRTRYHRSEVTLFLTFALDCKLHEVQKNSPAIPSELLYQHLLPSLSTNAGVLAQIRTLLAKKVGPENVEAAIRGLTEVQLQTPSGAVDFIHDDDRSLVEHLLRLN
ncbi:DUF4258 domain-containing protein [Ottowia sp.]|uniref:DUF4258 domain-containing protein n=1 Tax=Ottowia sp. TaxID=1898956 RepID=UPI0025D0EDF8|nr:DUF4258 domain-containing protein [Ottowia sp.]MBK6616408.1 DUF4258 domain-containing protein [Ottowia sp.]